MKTHMDDLMSSTSIWEMVLVAAYFLAVWLIPLGWLDTAMGAIAFAVASKINPFLSGYSIALAKDPQYFIHCHVLATWMLTFVEFPLIVWKNGGLAKTKLAFADFAQKRSVLLLWLAPAFVVSLDLTFLATDINYPLGRAERAVWESVTGFALIHGWVFSLALYATYFAIPLTWNHLFGNREN